MQTFCDVKSTPVLCFKVLSPPTISEFFFIYLAFQVIVKKQYMLYIPNSKFHDVAPLLVCQNLMKAAPKIYDSHGFCGELFPWLMIKFCSFFFSFSSCKLYLKYKFCKSELVLEMTMWSPVSDFASVLKSSFSLN